VEALGMDPIIATVLLGVVVAIIGAPLRRRPESAADPEAGRLEVAKEAKYREILDTELDYRTGKLSEPDYREIDTRLRAEAIALLDGCEPGDEDR
jgi:hypothetical protein